MNISCEDTPECVVVTAGEGYEYHIFRPSEQRKIQAMEKELTENGWYDVEVYPLYRAKT